MEGPRFLETTSATDQAYLISLIRAAIARSERVNALQHEIDREKLELSYQERAVEGLVHLYTTTRTVSRWELTNSKGEPETTGEMLNRYLNTLLPPVAEPALETEEVLPINNYSS